MVVKVHEHSADAFTLFVLEAGRCRGHALTRLLLKTLPSKRRHREVKRFSKVTQLVSRAKTERALVTGLVYFCF